VSDAGDEIFSLALKCDIPIVTTSDGKTLIDETGSYWAGVVGNYGMNCANQAVMKSDLVIFIGTGISDQVTVDWKVPSPDTHVVQIDIDGAELGRSYSNCIGLQGDAKTVISQLLISVSENKRPDWLKEVELLKNDTFEKYKMMLESNEIPINSARLCAELEKVIPDNGILVSDTGFTAIWTGTMVRMKKSQKYYRATGSLGWSFPGSIGIKCGAPDRTVINLVGDGGFYYHLAEMETQMRYGINTITVVDNNRTLSACISQTKSVYQDDLQKGLDMIQFSPISFARIAKEIGLFAICVEKPEDIVPAMQKALFCEKPALIEVITSPTQHLPPIW
jgi:acetolactate synthase-1/2/3 large subunit